jgi:hypothetical protein
VIRGASVAGGYLGLVVLYTLLQRGPSQRLGGLAEDLTGLLTRGFDPGVAGIPNRRDTAAEPAPQANPSGAPPGAPPAPKCPGGQPPVWIDREHRWVCVIQN